ncbi:hypothetical protein KL943_004072 [Ogataea angusta]|nr:hypothetical protein KL943_004072 [Ogataea angusta]
MHVPDIESGPDTFEILLTTDNHVGYLETDPIRGNDSWRTFSEIMSIAKSRDVDMVIQAGDLFHVNKPSKKSYYHVIRTLREFCWIDRPREYKLVSDPSVVMSTRHFNYPCEYDPNVNVGMPVYAISGNHDDATGDDLLSPLDLLSVGGLLNHFGRITNNDEIKVSPLLFQKGSTNFALYGLQSIREERLKRTLASGNVEFLQPEDSENWFSLMCVHQNHVPRPGTRVLEEAHLPHFLDFVFWGHEHECIPSPMHNIAMGFDILQGGSSVATSLSEGEVPDKHVYLLKIKGKDYSLEPIRLKSVRPFAMKDIVLSETGIPATSGNKEEVINLLIDEVEGLIEAATCKWKEVNQDLLETLVDIEIPLPLVRLRVEYSGGYEVENPRRFSNRFVGKVANINDIVIFYRKKTVGNKQVSRLAQKQQSEDHELEIREGTLNIGDFVQRQLGEDDLLLLKKTDMSKVIEEAMMKDDKHLIKKFVDDELGNDLELLLKLRVDETDNVEGKSLNELKKGFRNIVKELRAKAKYSERPSDQNEQPRVSSDLFVESDEEPSTRGRRKKRQDPVPDLTQFMHPSEPMVIDSDISDDGLIQIEEPKKTTRKKTTKPRKTASKPTSLFGAVGR